MKKLIGIFLLTAILGGCMRAPTIQIHKDADLYKSVPNIEYACDYKKTKENVTVSVRQLTQYQSKEHFAKNLVFEGYQPYQLNINNNTPDTLVLRSENIRLPLYQSKKIAKKLHRNTALWSVGGAVPIYFTINAFLPFFVVPPFAIWSWWQNRLISKNLRSRTIEDGDVIIIAPYSHLKRNFFVALEDSRNNFIVKLFDQDTQALIRFDVRCQQTN